MDWDFVGVGRRGNRGINEETIRLSRKIMLVVWTRVVAKGDINKLKVLRYILLIYGWERNEVVIQSREYKQI